MPISCCLLDEENNLEAPPFTLPPVRRKGIDNHVIVNAGPAIEIVGLPAAEATRAYRSLDLTISIALGTFAALAAIGVALRAHRLLKASRLRFHSQPQ